MTDYHEQWRIQGIRRLDFAGFSVTNDVPEDDYTPSRDICILEAYELPNNSFGFVLAGSSNALPNHRF